MLFGSANRGVPSFGDLAWHKPVQAYSLSALSACTLSPATGISFGQTLEKNTNGDINSEPFSGVSALSVGDRVLITSETAPKNGIYIITTQGGGASKWKLTRATDSDSATELPQGSVVISLEDLAFLYAQFPTAGDQWALLPAKAANFQASRLASTGDLYGNQLFMDFLNADTRIYRSAAATLTIDDSAGGDISTRLFGDLITGMTGSQGGMVNFHGSISVSIDADQNDWNPTGIGHAFEVQIGGLTANRTITGISNAGVVANGQLLWIHNNSSFSIILAYESASSSAVNRFRLPGAVNLTVRAHGSVLLVYTTSRWRAVAV